MKYLDRLALPGFKKSIRMTLSTREGSKEVFIVCSHWITLRIDKWTYSANNVSITSYLVP